MDVARGLRVVDGGTGEDVGVWRSAIRDARNIVLVTVKAHCFQLMLLSSCICCSEHMKGIECKVYIEVLESSVSTSTENV